MAKLSAMIRYELLMAWRRRSLPLLWILLLVGVTGFAMLVTDVSMQTRASIEAQIAAQQITREQYHTNMLFSVIVAGMICYSVGITLIVGEVIPLDVQFKVRELFGTLPVSTATFLGGKLFGMWVGIVLGWLIVGAISALAFRLIIGAYDLRVFLMLWVLLPLPAALTSAALSVLVAGLVNSRRMAVLVGLLVLPFAFYLNAVGVINFVNLTSLIDPIYTYGTLLLPSREQLVIDAARGLLTHIGVILGTWLIVLFLWRRREMHG